MAGRAISQPRKEKSMKRNALYIFLTLLLATALTALAQSPTSSNPGGSETKDPYGATLDHPNPGSTQGATGQSYNSNKVNEGQTPATSTPTTAEPSTSSSTPSTTDTSSGSMSSSATSGSSTSVTTDDTANKSLPRTASDLPLLATIGLLALGGALTVRSIAKRA
jgi:cobalamin biosynthesis Mg chelatase CobN